MATEQAPQQDHGTPFPLPLGDTGRIIPFPAPPGAPTEDEVRKANAGEYAPRGMERFLYWVAGNRIIKSLFGITAVGGTTWALYENVPAAHQFINESSQYIQGKADELYQGALYAARKIDMGIIPDLVDRLLPDPTPDIFDPNKALSRVTTKNSIGQPIQNITIKPIIEEAKRRLIVPIPFEIKEGMSIRSTGQGVFSLSNIPEDIKVVALMGGQARFSQTINRDGVQTYVSILFPDGEGYFRNLIYTTGNAQLLIPGATETTDYNYDGTVKVTRRILTTYVQPDKPLLSTRSDALHINVSPGAMDSTGGPAYKDGKGLPSTNFEIWPLTKNNKVVFINSQ